MKKNYSFIVNIMFCGLLLVLAACATSTAQAPQQQETVEINPVFQTLKTPVPTVPPYRCGAWSSNNAPGSGGTIAIYARLTKNVNGVSGAPATAVVHFRDFDLTLNQRPVSDTGGYVTFTLSLQGRQPRGTPATIDVSFQVEGKTVQCSQAFFTPR